MGRFRFKLLVLLGSELTEGFHPQLAPACQLSLLTTTALLRKRASIPTAGPLNGSHSER
jgi:hypothetical protein